MLVPGLVNQSIPCHASPGLASLRLCHQSYPAQLASLLDSSGSLRQHCLRHWIPAVELPSPWDMARRPCLSADENLQAMFGGPVCTRQACLLAGSSTYNILVDTLTRDPCPARRISDSTRYATTPGRNTGFANILLALVYANYYCRLSDAGSTYYYSRSTKKRGAWRMEPTQLLHLGSILS